MTRVNIESKAKKNKTIKYNVTIQQRNTNRKLHATRLLPRHELPRAPSTTSEKKKEKLSI
jgi:hypothetical protein